MSTVRLYVEAPLARGTDVPLAREHAHYLFNVMRLGVGDQVLLFNGCDGEWRADVAEAGKRSGMLRPVEQTRKQEIPPDIELIFAPIKKARTDFIVEKACELGCRSVRPVITRYTNNERLNLARLRAHMIEAAEQCEGLTVPDLVESVKLSALLENWNDRLLIVCDEARTAPRLDIAVSGISRGTPASVLIGPEGGFSAEEIKQLQSVESVVTASLGPRILRADTAAVAALALVQATLGDWSQCAPSD